MGTVINDPDLIVIERDSIAVIRHHRGKIEITVDTPAHHMEFFHERSDTSQPPLLSLFAFSSRTTENVKNPAALKWDVTHLGVSRTAGDAIWQHLDILSEVLMDVTITELEPHE